MVDCRLRITDSRSLATVTIPIDPHHNFIVASALKGLPVTSGDTVSCVLYDPGFVNTVVCRSKISLVKGETGQLFLRGYSIEELVENSSFLEVAYLLIHGDLPTASQLHEWEQRVMRHTYLHTELEQQIQTFRYNAHPMGMVIATLASLSTLHPDANPALAGDGLYVTGPNPNMMKQYKISSKEGLQTPSLAELRDFVRLKQIYRILGKMPTIAACAYRHREGRPFNHPMPNPDSYTQNFLYMLDKLDEADYKPDEFLVKQLDKMFILLAEHGSSCSTITMRHLISSGVDPYSALSGACGTLFGERKAGAVIHMLTEEIGSVENIPTFLDAVKNKRHSKDLSSTSIHNSSKNLTPLKLMGFGHRIYKVHDPRVKLAKNIAMELFKHFYPDAPDANQPSSHLIHLALKLEEAAQADNYFTSRGLYTNIDYWAAVVFYIMGFPSDMFPVLLSIPRSAGYSAHALESFSDKEYKIFRPRQLYQGYPLRPYVKIEDRKKEGTRQDLNSIGVRSNPAAQFRRDVGNEQTQTVEQVSNMIDHTRTSILTLSQELQTIMAKAQQ